LTETTSRPSGKIWAQHGRKTLVLESILNGAGEEDS
jgi:hypothetical protein